MSNYDKTYAGFPWWSLPNEEEKLPKQISYQSKIKANSLQEHLLLPLMLNWVSKGMLWELAVEIAFKKSSFTAQVGDGANWGNSLHSSSCGHIQWLVKLVGLHWLPNSNWTQVKHATPPGHSTRSNSTSEQIFTKPWNKNIDRMERIKSIAVLLLHQTQRTCKRKFAELVSWHRSVRWSWVICRCWW